MPAPAQRWQPCGRRGRSATYSGPGELSHPQACCRRVWGCSAKNSLMLQLESAGNRGRDAGQVISRLISSPTKIRFCFATRARSGDLQKFVLWGMESSWCGFFMRKSQGTGLWSCFQGQHNAKPWHREEGIHSEPR